QASSNRVAKPAWVPPTLALALWKLDRRDAAVACHAAAVRTYPDRWTRVDALPGLLPDWRDGDGATPADVLAGWTQDPAAWPCPAAWTRRGFRAKVPRIDSTPKGNRCARQS